MNVNNAKRKKITTPPAASTTVILTVGARISVKIPTINPLKI
jgi:hypothetical protein